MEALRQQRMLRLCLDSKCSFGKMLAALVKAERLALPWFQMFFRQNKRGFGIRQHIALPWFQMFFRQNSSRRVVSTRTALPWFQMFFRQNRTTRTRSTRAALPWFQMFFRQNPNGSTGSSGLCFALIPNVLSAKLFLDKVGIKHSFALIPNVLSAKSMTDALRLVISLCLDSKCSFGKICWTG